LRRVIDAYIYIYMCVCLLSNVNDEHLLLIFIIYSCYFFGYVAFTSRALQERRTREATQAHTIKHLNESICHFHLSGVVSCIRLF
jgi:hypothetical protein